MKSILYYCHDPMCSWCWGFRPVWQELQTLIRTNKLTETMEIQYVLGGLAPDNAEPMAGAMQETIKSTWEKIQNTIPGTQFNYEFWHKCQPRRSTYIACRAILAAHQQSSVDQDMKVEMLRSIQQAYYLSAMNPSDEDDLIFMANKLGLDEQQFVSDLNSASINQVLMEEIELCHSLYVSSFPSLVLKHGENYNSLQIHYTQADEMMKQIIAFMI